MRARIETQRAWYQRNKETINAKRKEYYEKNKERILARNRAYNQKHLDRNKAGRYKTTPEQINALIVAQAGLCPICQKPLPVGKQRHIDHCHATGTIRGVLCRLCNLGLGNFKDNHNSLLRAASYVTKARGRGNT